MNKIKESGNYLAVKIPEISYGFEIYSLETKGLMYLVAGDHCWEYEDFPEKYSKYEFSIIGLLSDQEDPIQFMNLCIPPNESNQWLIIEKIS